MTVTVDRQRLKQAGWIVYKRSTTPAQIIAGRDDARSARPRPPGAEPFGLKAAVHRPPVLAGIVRAVPSGPGSEPQVHLPSFLALRTPAEPPEVGEVSMRLGDLEKRYRPEDHDDQRGHAIRAQRDKPSRALRGGWRRPPAPERVLALAYSVTCQAGGLSCAHRSAAMMRRVAAGRLPRTMSSFSMMIGSPPVDPGWVMDALAG